MKFKCRKNVAKKDRLIVKLIENQHSSIRDVPRCPSRCIFCCNYIRNSIRKRYWRKNLSLSAPSNVDRTLFHWYTRDAKSADLQFQTW